jgi:hypothetical protein
MALADDEAVILPARVEHEPAYPGEAIPFGAGQLPAGAARRLDARP